VARATIRLANTLGLHVVAEGVENEAQLKWLRSESCALIQGYLFSQPLDVEACGQLLAAGRDPSWSPTPISLN
jgi:EAL domain-containing protein (putative c-di-GMP-specific phosphodiesterase class I)